MPEPLYFEGDRFNNAFNSMEPFDVKTKVAYNGGVLVIYINPPLSLEDFFSEIRGACHFDSRQIFTVKWIDEEGDPCTISSQLELDEAFRLYEINRDSELFVHVFPNVPLQPGLPCQGEDKHVYRRGARRWKKFYQINGHSFQAKRLNKRAVCAICRGTIWGLGRQGFRCVYCKLPVHKKCHKLVRNSCAGDSSALTASESYLTLHGNSNDIDQNRLSVITNGADSSKIYGYDNQLFARTQIIDKTAVIAAANEGFTDETAVPASRLNAVSLEDFNLLKIIGRGSYAKVLQVEYKKTSQVYAMKVIKKTMVTDDEDIDWVQTEKHVFEIASNHPFLVGLHSCFQTPSRLFFIIEFVPGGDMMFHMQRQRKLPEEHARFYSAEIILALQFLHRRGVIYRDLKLDNVLLDAEGHVKLADFGMCKEGIMDGVLTSTFCGTPNYIAPEILRGEEYGFSVDWWALGVLMYEMMAGRSPFDIVANVDAPDQQTEDYLFQVILEKTIRIPRSLSVKAAAVLKMFLNKNPTERLGCKPSMEDGFKEIKDHTFFKSVEWELLEVKQVTPPYQPPVVDDRDVAHFDKQFTDEAVQFTPEEESLIRAIDQSEFDGFEYVNPFLMTTSEAV